MHTNGNIKCGNFINCIYTFDGIEVTVTSNEAGELTLKANKTPMTGKGFLCPSTINIDATYTALGTGMYIES